MNVWTPTRPTPAWTHRPPRQRLYDLMVEQILTMDRPSAPPYGPGAFAAAPVAPADPDASPWPQAGAQPVLWAHDHTNPLGLRITVDPTLPPDRIELRPTPTRVEQIADLIAAHRPDWSTDGKIARVGCDCGWWCTRTRGVDVEVQHARHLATLIGRLDQPRPASTGNLTAMRAERARTVAELADANRSIRELRECLAAAQADADSRSSMAATWLERALDGYEKIGALQEETRACVRQRAAAADEHQRLVDAVRALLANNGTTVRPSVLGPLMDALRG